MVFLTIQLRQQGFDDLTAHVGQAVVTTLKSIGQLCVVQTEEVQNRGVQIVNMNFVFDGVKPELIGFAVPDAWFDAAAR